LLRCAEGGSPDMAECVRSGLETGLSGRPGQEADAAPGRRRMRPRAGDGYGTGSKRQQERLPPA